MLNPEWMEVLRDDDVLSPGEVAKLFHVNSKTVTRWADAGKLKFFRTPGGHRRYRRSDIEAVLLGGMNQGEG